MSVAEVPAPDRHRLAEVFDQERGQSLEMAVELAQARWPGFRVQPATEQLLERVNELDIRIFYFGVNGKGVTRNSGQGCAAIAPYRDFGYPAEGRQGAPLTHELKTLVYQDEAGRYIFVHCRGNAQVDTSKLEGAYPGLQIADLAPLGLEYGQVTPFTQIPDADCVHVFDDDLLQRYERANRMTTNAHDPHLFVEFCPEQLIRCMKKRGGETRVMDVREGEDPVLALTHHAYTRLINVLGGNGPETSAVLKRKIHLYTRKLLQALQADIFPDLSRLHLKIDDDPRTGLSMRMDRYGGEVISRDWNNARLASMIGGTGQGVPFFPGDLRVEEHNMVVIPCNTRTTIDADAEQVLGRDYVSLASSGLQAVERVRPTERQKVLLVACEAARRGTYTNERLAGLSSTGSEIVWPSDEENSDLDRIVRKIKSVEADVTHNRTHDARGAVLSWIGHVTKRLNPDLIAIANTEVDILARIVTGRHPEIGWVSFLDECAKNVVARAFNLPTDYDSFVLSKKV